MCQKILMPCLYYMSAEVCMSDRKKNLYHLDLRALENIEIIIAKQGH